MTTIVDMQNAIAGSFRDNINEFKQVEGTKGARFFRSLMSRSGSSVVGGDAKSVEGGLGMRMPAAIISPIMTTKGIAISNRQLDVPIQWGAYIFCAGRDRDDAVMLLLQQAISLIIYNQWGLDDVSVPVMDSVTAQSLPIPELSQIGVVGWGITWRQAMRIGNTREEVSAAFSELVISEEITPPSHPELDQ